MTQTFSRRTRQSMQSETDTLPLLGPANRHQSPRKPRPTPRSTNRQEKPTPAHGPTRPPSVDRISRPRTRSGNTSQASSRREHEHPCERESFDIYEHESVGDQREHVRLRWMGRLRRKPHRQQSEERGC